jgi:heat shock protein HspQ
MSKQNSPAMPIRTSSSSATLPGALPTAPLLAHARYRIGDRVRHAIFEFRGIIFDVDPVFANSEEWYEANGLQPDRNQPFYHLLADNGEQSYVAYVSQQNLVPDEGRDPIDHPAIAGLFERLADGAYRLDSALWH